MAYLTSKRIGKKERFFLVKSVRIADDVKKITVSLGAKRPNNKEMKMLNELYESHFALEEARLKADYSSKRYESRYFTQKQIREIEVLRHFYKIYLHRLKPSELEKYKENFLVRYVYNTTSIEGNTTTLPETALILLKKVAPKGKELREIHEIENYENLIKYMNGYRGDVTKKLILKIHKILLRNIDNEGAGRFRRIKVYIPGSEMKPPKPEEVEPMIENLIDYYFNSRNICPLERAATFHHRFEKIHPFTDGNGRVGRELLNFILKKSDFPPLIIEVKKRQQYIKALMKADKGDLYDLVSFISKTMTKQYSDLVDIDENRIKERLEEYKKGKL